MPNRAFWDRMLSVAALAALAVASLAGTRAIRAQSSADAAASPPAAHFALSSPDLPEHGSMHAAQVNTRCGGRDVSPALAWHDPPDGTRSFALLVHDPDAPQAEGFWHWIVYDIPASARSLPAGAGDPRRHLLPSGAVQGRSDFGTEGYGGPCPPPGRPHRYVFRLYALPVATLNVPPDATATVIASYADAAALGKAQLIAHYGR
ncbi:MAG TPA: YbhB/YbcL family Raf kinase inhibitor-like protein [Steroidobacteraceae bacterium]|nr:YbhB/YbcL family Raf kinase inhibitor-like protein [Steroidobacteraceae bacterium]